MTPAARVQAAIEIIDDWRTGPEPLDRLLLRWGRTHRFAGSGDRHAIADLVYDAVRCMRSAAWSAGAGEYPTARQILRGRLVAREIDSATIFTGARHAPEPISESELGEPRPLAAAPRPVRLDFPDWLEPDLATIDDSVLAALRERAPLDVRVNTLKCDLASARDRLADEGITTVPGPLVSTALRVIDGQRWVRQGAAYREGLIEIQDAASQAVAAIASAQPGETVLDLCAGGGGKTLALAAAMQGRGRLMAHDIAPARMSGLPERAARAGALVEILPPDGLGALTGACDLVLVDAPCSGSGAWRRNPDAKWRLSRAALTELTRAQAALLRQAMRLAAARGRIVYATCSLLDCENRAIVDGFLETAPGWRLAEQRSLTPLDGGDGFYMAALTRT